MSTTYILDTAAAGLLPIDIAVLADDASLNDVLVAYTIGAFVMMAVIAIHTLVKPPANDPSDDQNSQGLNRHKAPRIWGIKLGRAREY